MVAAVFTTASAQAPSWAWAVQAGEKGVDVAVRAAADSAGTIYVAAGFADSASFASGMTRSFGKSDALAARLGADGTWLWAYPVGGPEADAANDVETDAAGNVYLLATVLGDSARIASLDGTTTLALKGESDFVLAKYDPQGHLLWARSGGGAGADRGAGLAVGADGSVYVTGRFTATMHVAAGSVASAGGSDAFIAVFAANGDLRRLWRGGGAGDDTGNGIGVDAAGNTYLVGEFTGSADIGDTTLTAAAERNLLLARFAPDGSTGWAMAEGGDQYNGYQPHIAVSPSGGVHIVGLFYGRAVIGGGAFNSTGESDGYLMAYDSQGSPLWGKQFGGGMIQSPGDIITDSNGNVYVTGGSQDLPRGNIFAIAFSAAGTQLWSQFDDGASVLHNAREGGITVDRLGNIYMTGGFGGQINFGGTRLTSAGSTPNSISGSDLFVARLGNNVAGAGGGRRDDISELHVTGGAGEAASVRFGLRSAGMVRLELYDLRGALVRTLLDETLGAGEHHLPVPDDLPQGAYFLLLQAGGGVSSHPLAVTR